MIEIKPHSEPLFVRQTPQERRANLLSFADNQEPRLDTVPLQVLLDEITDYYYRRPVPIPFVEFHGLYLRPFWRDYKKTPPLPYNDPTWNLQVQKTRKQSAQ